MCVACTGSGLTRRHLFRAGGAALAAAALPLAFGASIGDAEAATALSPDQAIARLKEGNARYVTNTSTNKDYSVGRAARAEGQSPFAAILSCADSRVAPELLFDEGPGELFVVRVAGNFASQELLASLEYGVSVLGVPLIMVLGHTSCGAIDATIKTLKGGGELPGALNSLVNAIAPAVEAAEARKPADLLAEATIENVRRNIDYLKTAWPIISEAVDAGKVGVIGGVYDIATGMVNPV